jgi:hypothetical protein
VQLDHEHHVLTYRFPDRPHRSQCRREVGVADHRAATVLGVRVERPDLHAADALGKQVFGQSARVVEEALKVLQRPVAPSEPQDRVDWPPVRTY